MKLNFYCPSADYSCDFSSLVLGEQLDRVYVLSILAFEPTKDMGKHRTTDRGKEIYVASVSAWLCRDMDCAVAKNLVSAEEISMSESENYLRPSTDIVGAIYQLKWVVPNYSPICLLRLVTVLRHSTLVALQLNKLMNTYINNMPISSRDEVIFATEPIIITDLARLNMSAYKHIEGSESWLNVVLNIEVVASVFGFVSQLTRQEMAVNMTLKDVHLLLHLVLT